MGAVDGNDQSLVEASKTQARQSITEMTYRKELGIVSNDIGATFFEQISDLKKDVENGRKSYFLVRERAIITWIEDALGGKKSPERSQRREHLNKDVILAGDIWLDSVMALRRFQPEEKERVFFPKLYGIGPERVQALLDKCPLSLEFLNSQATGLLEMNRPRLSKGSQRIRDRVVGLLDHDQFDDAENLCDSLLKREGSREEGERKTKERKKEEERKVEESKKEEERKTKRTELQRQKKKEKKKRNRQNRKNRKNEERGRVSE